MKVYCTSFCNKGHRVRDGMPVAHECHVLPPKALAAEIAGDCRLAIEIQDASKPLRVSRGARAS